MEISFWNLKFLIIAWQHSGFRTCDAFDWTCRMDMVSITREPNGRWTMISKPLLHFIIIIVYLMWNVNYTNQRNHCGSSIVHCILWPIILYLNKLSTYMTCFYHYYHYDSTQFDHIWRALGQCNCLFTIQSKTLPIRSINEWPSHQPKIW